MFRLPSWLTAWFRWFPPAEPAPDPPPSSSPALLSAVNAARRSYGLAPLASHAGLDAVAGGWARRLASRERLSHNDLGLVMSAVPGSVAAGECVAEARDADEAVQEWTNDPPHRNIILGDYTKAGCGAAGGYWVLDVVR